MRIQVFAYRELSEEVLMNAKAPVGPRVQIQKHVLVRRELGRAVDSAPAKPNLTALLFNHDLALRYLAFQHFLNSQGYVGKDSVLLLIEAAAYGKDLCPDDCPRSDDHVVVRGNDNSGCETGSGKAQKTDQKD